MIECVMVGCIYTFFKDFNFNTMMIELLDLELAERCMVAAEICTLQDC